MQICRFFFFLNRLSVFQESQPEVVFSEAKGQYLRFLQQKLAEELTVISNGPAFNQLLREAYFS